MSHDTESWYEFLLPFLEVISGHCVQLGPFSGCGIGAFLAFLGLLAALYRMTASIPSIQNKNTKPLWDRMKTLFAGIKAFFSKKK